MASWLLLTYAYVDANFCVSLPRMVLGWTAQTPTSRHHSTRLPSMTKQPPSAHSCVTVPNLRGGTSEWPFSSFSTVHLAFPHIISHQQGLFLLDFPSFNFKFAECFFVFLKMTWSTFELRIHYFFAYLQTLASPGTPLHPCCWRQVVAARQPLRPSWRTVPMWRP